MQRQFIHATSRHRHSFMKRNYTFYNIKSTMYSNKNVIKHIALYERKCPHLVQLSMWSNHPPLNQLCVANIMLYFKLHFRNNQHHMTLSIIFCTYMSALKSTALTNVNITQYINTHTLFDGHNAR